MKKLISHIKAHPDGWVASMIGGLMLAAAIMGPFAYWFYFILK